MLVVDVAAVDDRRRRGDCLLPCRHPADDKGDRYRHSRAATPSAPRLAKRPVVGAKAPLGAHNVLDRRRIVPPPHAGTLTRRATGAWQASGSRHRRQSRATVRPDIVPAQAEPTRPRPAARSASCKAVTPMILLLSRGHYCPKDHQQHLELAGFYSKIAVAYTQQPSRSRPTTSSRSTGSAARRGNLDVPLGRRAQGAEGPAGIRGARTPPRPDDPVHTRQAPGLSDVQHLQRLLLGSHRSRIFSTETCARSPGDGPGISMRRASARRGTAATNRTTTPTAAITSERGGPTSRRVFAAPGSRPRGTRALASGDRSSACTSPTKKWR